MGIARFFSAENPFRESVDSGVEFPVKVCYTELAERQIFACEVRPWTVAVVGIQTAYS